MICLEVFTAFICLFVWSGIAARACGPGSLSSGLFSLSNRSKPLEVLTASTDSKRFNAHYALQSASPWALGLA